MIIYNDIIPAREVALLNISRVKRGIYLARLSDAGIMSYIARIANSKKRLIRRPLTVPVHVHALWRRRFLELEHATFFFISRDLESEREYWRA